VITFLFHRKRLLFWLLRAYIKKRKKTIVGFFLAGIIVSLLSFIALPKIAPTLLVNTQKVGIVGTYTIETLPLDIQNKISLGLTSLTASGEATPSAALSFANSADGKTYTFVLRDDLYWQDGKKFTAYDVNYNFKDAQITAKSDSEVIVTLKEPFAPFPTVLSQPLFRKGLVGLSGGKALAGYGEYKVAAITPRGSFVSALAIEGNTRETQGKRIMYKFYPNEEEAKMRFMLGEVQTLINIIDPNPFQNWKSVQISSLRNYNQLVTVFYNTSLPLLSDKSVRQALTYAIPRDFPQEALAASPINPKSWAYAAQNKYSPNVETAQKLLKESKEATGASEMKLTLTTTPQFKDLAQEIKTEWKKIDVETTLQIVDIIPPDPQVLLERFKIPNDPDQYILWHSLQNTNVSHFSNPKIDKLLEDGRQTTNIEERLQIYTDFQRHIMDEAPAAFLYYPTVYTISRK